ncbi:MAG: hypothetical protein O4805_19430, partial [Trichodesmium sp. St16_bin2-tuft]|nr:hypothetical protein [Trichodesmium sp. St16_bin2-tuft]
CIFFDESGFKDNQDCIYITFQIDKPHCHNQNLVGTFHGTSLLWSTKIKTAVIQQELPFGTINTLELC